jgi:hypothetical protein
MQDPMRDQGFSGGATDRADSIDYRLRETEARLDRRLEALESQRDRLRWLARLMAGGFAVTLFALVVVLRTAWADGGVLETGSLFTQEVVIRDHEGIARGRLGTDADGRTQLSLSDRDGRGRIRLTVLPDGSPGVTISDADSRPRVVLGYLPDGTASLVFADAQGTSRAVVGLGTDGSTHALFADPAGTIRTLVGVDADGAPSVSVFQGEETGIAAESVAGY